jgi:hypothetical protein
MRNRKYAAVAVLAFVLIALVQAFASITGSISGVVRDKSGAVIAGATVVATDTLTGIQTPLSGIATFAKGEPVQISETDDNSFRRTFADTIDEPSYASNGSPLFVNKNPRNSAGQPYFNPAYFTQELPGEVGNSMRRFFSGPGIYNFDMALLKDTKLTESTQLQFRAEAFNVFNHARFNNPSGNFNNSVPGGFGYVTSARDPRIMQLALKLSF